MTRHPLLWVVKSFSPQLRRKSPTTTTWVDLIIKNCLILLSQCTPSELNITTKIVTAIMNEDVSFWIFFTEDSVIFRIWNFKSSSKRVHVNLYLMFATRLNHFYLWNKSYLICFLHLFIYLILYLNTHYSRMFLFFTKFSLITNK